MDNSGGSAGGVLERYGQKYTEENKMDLIHEMRLRMIESPAFSSEKVYGAILYLDSVNRGLAAKLIRANIMPFLKIDSGLNPDGTLKEFDLDSMISIALKNKCIGTKMRSFIDGKAGVGRVIEQQFSLAQKISDAGLLPIIEPEVNIHHPNKNAYELIVLEHIKINLSKYNGKCILKLTLPETSDLYIELAMHSKVERLVALSGGYSLQEACSRLEQNSSMSASFSRALNHGIRYQMNPSQYNAQLKSNIDSIYNAST